MLRLSVTVSKLSVSSGVKVALKLLFPTLPTLVVAGSVQFHPVGSATSAKVSPYVAVSPVGIV